MVFCDKIYIQGHCCTFTNNEYFSLLYFSSLSLIPNNTSNLFYFSHLSLFSYSLLFISLFSLSLHNQTHHRISNEVEVSKGKNKCEVFDWKSGSGDNGLVINSKIFMLF
jgi:hypothetical protein